MKTFMRVLLLSLAVMLAVMPSVSAATIDGLDIAITTNKEEYKKHDDILVTHTITNTNDQAVSNMVLESKIPEGYKADPDKTYVKEVKELAPGEKITLTTTLDSTTPRRMTTLSIILICAGGVVVLGAGLSVTMLVLQHKKKKQAVQLLSLVLCIGLLGGAVMPVMASSDPTTLNLTHEVLVDDKPLLLPATLTYDPIYGEKANLIVDTAEMLFDEETQTYHLLSEMPDLTGTLLYTEGVKSATCVITDDNENLLFSQSFTPKNMWAVEDVGLIVGVNHICVTVEYDDEMTYECAFKVNNVCEKNMESLDVDKGDTDEDGVLNFIEELKHTDPNNPDTDADNLTDYDEIATLGTDPLKPDTDGNGVTDGDEDVDKDGLTNQEEIHTHQSNPVGVDSDGDHLPDGDEVKTHGTDPAKADTDDDGKKDGWELDNDFDPLVPNTDFPEEEVPVPDYVDVESDGEVTITEVENDFFINEETPGYIGVNPVDVEIEEGHTATITMEYNPENIEGEKPTMYRFNTETQRCEEIESTFNANKVTATVNKSGMYVLLNHRLVEDVWTNDIFRPSEFNKEGTIDMVFVIDRSASMDSNDPSGLRKLVTKEFIGKLRDTDRAAAVQFTAIAEVISELTTDKETVCNTVDQIQNSDGGGCAGSDTNAGTNGSAGIRAALNVLEGSTAAYKYIIFLTDGDDTHHAEEYTNLTSEAKSKNIIIHTVGLVGTGGVNIEQLKKVAADTDGQYFLATVGEEPENNPELFEIYDQIESVTIDRHLDSNNDGISDYYTRLICEDKLVTQTGTRDLFGGYSYDEIQKNADFDGDGIKNGDELVITETKTGVFVKVVSLPYMKDSDDDGLLDNEEVNIGTSPVRLNSHVAGADVEFLTNSDAFASVDFLEQYNKDVLLRGQVWVGNVFFGTALDQTVLYRQALLDYFDALSSQILPDINEIYIDQTFDAYIDAQTKAIQEEAKRVAEQNDPAAWEKFAKGVSEFYKGINDTWNITSNTMQGIAAANEFASKTKILSDIAEGIRYLEVGKYIDIIGDLGDGIKICTKADDLASAKVLEVIQDGFRVLAKNGGFGNTLELVVKSPAFKTATEVTEAVGPVLDVLFLVVDTATNVMDSIRNYGTIVGQMETIEDNLYILDCIAANSDNVYLSGAASDIYWYLDDYASGFGGNFWIAMDQAAGVITELGANIVHIAIGLACPYVELARTIGNFIFKMDKKAENAAKAVALTAAAEIIAKNYKAHLTGGYAAEINEMWVAYHVYSEEIYVRLLHLAMLRKMAEEQYDLVPKSSDTVCAKNVAKCDTIIQNNTKNYYLYLQKVRVKTNA